MPKSSAWLIPFFPLLGCLITACAGKWLKKFAHIPVVAGIALAFVVSFFLWSAAGSPGTTVVYQWISLDSLDIPIIFRIDGLTTMMLAMVTFVATLVAVFAIGYMADDPAYPRFFACVGLFVFSMTGLVLSSNLALTYAFWEGVGVCSYLLIGFWYAKPEAAAAAKKAFMLNRFGDFGFMTALLLIWSSVHTLDYDSVFKAETIASIPETTRFWIALLLFWGATAKSAQLPLYVWLPDAMEGPTPVSALIHAATMVTAGVYLVARSAPLIVTVPSVSVIVAVVGCLTALLAALIALTQTDLKRVLAYSTISQLGYMFMGLGAGMSSNARFAITAGMFHLFTHAFFKALLFLGSGSVMHAMGGVIDMRRFGGLRNRLPYTHLTFGIGSLALAGIFPLAGFWSKDEILGALSAATHAAHELERGDWALVYSLVYCGAIFTAFLTAFYTGRAYFMTFWGPEKLPSPDDPEAVAVAQGSHDAHGHDAHGGSGDAHGHDDHGHGGHVGQESPDVMLIPLYILAGCAVLAGIVFGPTGWFAGHLETTPTLQFEGMKEHAFSWGIALFSTAVAVAGGYLSFIFYAEPNGRPAEIARSIKPLYNLSLNKFYVDELYTWMIVKPTRVLALIAQFLDDYLVHGVLVRGTAWLPRLLGRDALSPSQNGLLQFYAASTALCVAVLFIVLMLM